MKTLRSSLLVLASVTAALVPVSTAAPASVLAQDDVAVRTIDVTVTTGYSPNRIVIAEGERARLRFVRRVAGGCTGEVVLPWLGITRALPPHEPVVIDLPPMTAGEYDFHCGMNMVHGTVVVEPVR